MPELYNGKQLLNLADLKPLVNYDAIIDATSGGLIVGRLHKEGGINLIKETLPSKYEVIAEVEGWEYILNPFATEKYFSRIQEINFEFAKCKNAFFNYKVADYINKLDTRFTIPELKSASKILIVGEYRQFIVNKYSTRKYIEELDKMNKTNN